MHVIKWFMVALCLVSLSACSITQIKGKIGGVEVEAKDENSKSGKFCPPGQAKKGNC